MADQLEHKPLPGDFCVGKRCHTKRDAQTQRNFRSRSGRKKLRIYQCPLCNWWHLTHHVRQHV